MADKLTSKDREWHRRQARWRHNGYLGSVAMMKANLNSIIRGETVSPETKKLAVGLIPGVEQLDTLVRERRIPIRV